MLLFHGPTVSLYPSIGNLSTCRAHYVIRENRVIESRPFADWEIEAVQARDEAKQKRYYDGSKPDKQKAPAWWDRLFRD